HLTYQSAERPSPSSGAVESVPKSNISASGCHFAAAAFARPYAVWASTGPAARAAGAAARARHTASARVEAVFVKGSSCWPRIVPLPS
ncbi:MAG TPA: hypothetical protein PLB01_17470, partial [Thermoanaerobaculia bacterium]|nr:hypothetical protein [Thermoanaerobaculia bacterium]